MSFFFKLNFKISKSGYCVSSFKTSISSLQIGLNVPLKDSKYSRVFKMISFSAIDYESLTHWSAELSGTGSLHLSDGSNE